MNNAAIAGPTCPIEETEQIDWQRTLDVNLTGAFLCTRRAVPLLKEASGGAIVLFLFSSAAVAVCHASARRYFA
jgi:NAD(P)-dependent dehydrogenase (short-subunit alcohol dehydrogenase family)